MPGIGAGQRLRAVTGRLVQLGYQMLTNIPLPLMRSDFSDELYQRVEGRL